MEYIIVYPESHRHLGLFEDLKNYKNVRLVSIEKKDLHSSILKKIRKLHLSWSINRYVRLPGKQLWYQSVDFSVPEGEEICIIVMDIALRALHVKELNKLFARPYVRGVLVLINAMDAGSPGMLEIKPKINRVHWADVYSFDPSDVERYGFRPLGCCYYSMPNAKMVLQEYGTDPEIIDCDAYYMGGLKGGRGYLILSLYRYLKKNGITLNFNLTVRRDQTDRTYADGIHYITGGWIPYHKVLASTLKSNVIIEVLQQGQTGPSLRYYEAICYNKKLLTNNPHVVKFPYYDERYIRIFSDVEDIDIEWIHDKTTVDYGYKGDFSPTKLLQTVVH